MRYAAALAVAAGIALLVGFASGGTADQQIAKLAENANFAAIYKSPLVIEGLTADSHGSFWVIGRGATGCPIWKLVRGAGELMGTEPAPCSPSGLAFDAAGRLYIADADKIWAVTPSSSNPAA